ncbi:MAG: hypothetical protein L3J23_05350 [Flavobacteriaceae bacterium]|nr:hypothetical protein [Flavobacteriaceae bacterium]
MKKQLLLLLLILLFFKVTAQECNAVLFLKEGAVLEYTDYNKKGKKASTSTHETLTVSEEENKLVAKIKVTLQEVKEEKPFSITYNAYCENGIFSIDMLRSFNISKLSKYNTNEGGGFDLDIEGDILSFPVDMTEESELKDGSFTIKIGNNGFALLTILTNITNRKIHAKETITTSAGTFICQKITFDFDSKIGIIRTRGSGAEWYQDDKVLVKSESYNKKGKLIAYSELTSIK